MAVFTITTLNDDGLGSLRQAILDANALLGSDLIIFDPSLSKQTITLTSDELLITDDLTIDGDVDDDGGFDITVSRDPNAEAFRIFNIDDDDFTADLTVTLDGLKITGGLIEIEFFPGGGSQVEPGGGILNRENLIVKNSEISGNSAENRGGGIYSDNINGTLTVSNSTISGNSAADDGGGIAGFNVTISDSTISGNSAAEEGGGIYSNFSLAVTNSTISSNSGSGISHSYTAGDVLTVTDSTISNNTGSGINPFRTDAIVTNSTISSNNGGIVFADGDLTVINSTISDNSSRYIGGIAKLNGYVQVINSTISGNSVTGEYGDGGGLYLRTAIVTITNSTISGNSAVKSGGGVENLDSSIIVNNSIIAGNESEVDPDVTNRDEPSFPGNGFISNGANLIGDPGNTTGFNFDETFAGQDITDISEVLDTTLQNNGGPTETLALVPGSPAIDGGINADAVDEDDNPLTTDQRGTGFDRIVNGQTDIGAFEVQAPSEISLQKLVNGEDITSIFVAPELIIGDTLTFSYLLRNTGSESLSDVVIVDDNGTPNDPSDDFTITGPPLSGDENGNELLDPNEVWTYEISTFVQDLSQVIDFDQDPSGHPLQAGTVIDDEYQTLDDLIISTPRNDYGAMIFDSFHPTGGDFDLRSPRSINEDETSEGIGNNVPLGNVLIIAEDGDSHDPDDEKNGGTLRFKWGNLIRPTSIQLLDIDKDESAFITTQSRGIQNSFFRAGSVGDNSVQRIELEKDWVDQLDLELSGSGAIAELTYVGAYQNVATVSAKGSDRIFTSSDVSYYTNAIPAIIFGTPFDDVLFGTTRNDTINGLAGNDRIFADFGDDIVLGGDGDDFIQDTGEAQGNPGQDRIFGEEGNDVVFGGGGKDLISGGTGNDFLRDDPLGNGDNDEINGDDGNDRIFGDDGEDILRGGLGNDVVFGGRDDDLLSGGDGADTFVFRNELTGSFSELGVDEIIDFQSDLDSFELSQETFEQLSPGQLSASEFDVVSSDADAAISSALIVYSTATGNLFYNEDRTDIGFGNGGQFAVLTGIPELSADQFVVI